MSAAATGVAPPPQIPEGAAPARRRREVTPARVLLAVAAGLVLLSVVRVVTGADDLSSSGTVGASLRLAVPIGLAGIGGLWAERSGIVNIGLEGMMTLGTWAGAWAGYQWGPWWGVLAGVAFGALGGALHALATVTFGVDHIVSGVAINILGAGIARYLSALFFEGVPGGGVTQSPKVDAIGTITVPGVSDGLASIEKHGWFLISDLAGLLGGFVTNLSLLTVVAILMVPLTYVVLWRTSFGLRLRSCGENPLAAESLGINVYRMKYYAVIASGAFAGLGGAFLSEVASSIYREGQTNGRGYIGLAAMIFGNWRPGGLAAGASIFGYTDAAQLRQGETSVHALLLLVAILVAAVSVLNLVRRRPVAAAIGGVVTVVLLLWFFLTDQVPSQFVSFAPHVTTLLVLSLAAQRLRMPAADGLPYRRGQGS